MASFKSTIKFADLPIHKDTLKAVKAKTLFGYTNASKAQSQFLPVLLEKDQPDVFVKATTGSGKTLGFLIPLIEMIVADSKARDGVHSIIMSPTRDLALQTLKEAQKLLTYHAGIKAEAVIGGTSMTRDISVLKNNPPKILVATPGRLEALFKEKKLAGTFETVQAIVLDEADRLLEQGFVRAIERICNAIPSPRRTILVTATVPDEVKAVAKKFMKKEYKYVDTVGEEKVDQSQIDQYYRLSDPACLHVAMHRELKKRMATKDYKILFFFPATNLVDFYAEVFQKDYNIDVLKLHGDIPQHKRTKNTETFRTSKNVIMFASDAAGRGMDFPGVTCVLQMGVVDATQYKQRIGRTGRGGNKGEAVIILGTDETKMLDMLKSHFPSLQEVTKSPTRSSAACLAIEGMPEKVIRRVFLSTLGAYKSKASELGWNNKQLVESMQKRFAYDVDPTDTKMARMFKKMGIKL